MRNSTGRWTGVAVTALVVFGCDLDVAYAVPLGLMAAALATIFVTLAESGLTSRVSIDT